MHRFYHPMLRRFADFVALRYKPRPTPRKPRVLHVTPQYFADESYIGGGERYPMELARAMAEYTPTRIVSFGNRRHSLRYGRARLEVYPTVSWRDTPSNPLALGFLPALRRADVIHCYQFHYRITVVAVLAAAVMRKPVFVTDLGGYATPLSTYLGLSRCVCSFLNLTKFSEEWTGSGERSKLIYGGVDTDHFSPPVYGSTRDHFLYVGRLMPHKGIDVLIEAAGDDIPLTIVGRPYDDRYYTDLQRLAEGNRIRFVTGSDDAELLRLYRTAEAVILPSVYTDMYGEYRGNPEYLGLTLLEGMACGAPAICTEVGGMPEIVEDGITGFVVPPNDAAALRACLLKLRHNPALVSEMGNKAVEHVRSKFTWHKVAERCLEAYRAGGLRGGGLRTEILVLSFEF